MFKNINKAEWKFLAAVWIIVVFIVFWPIVIGFFMTPSGSVFLFRPILNNDDYAVYFSQINQAKHGIYFWKNLFTQESQTVGVFNPFWSFVGLLARMLNLSSFVALQLASFILIPFFLLSAYCLVSYFFEEKNKRKICFIFFVFASGLGWLLSTFVNKVLSIDVTTFTPYILFGAPHMIASLTLIILIFLFSLYTFDKYKIIYSLWAGFCAFLLFSFHPYHVCTIFGVLGAFLVVEFLIDKKIYFEHIVHYIILLIFSAPPIIYYLWCFLNIPVYYQTLFLQNVTLTPALWIVLADFSALLILAILGIISLVKEKNINRKNIFLIVWVITQFFLIYLPINTNRRLLEGLSIPITILAVYGIFFLENWLKNNSKSLYKLYCLSSFSLFVYIFCLSIFFIFTIDLSFFEYNPTLAYLKKDNENTMIWLKENTPEQSVVLSSYENGNIIPVIASRPVYYGHWSGTVRASEKSILSYNFFKKDDDQERRIFLETNNINYLFFGPEEKKEASFDPEKDKFLQKVYSNSTVAVYKVD